MQQESAETLGLKALTWLIGNDELLPVFLGSTGGDIAQIRAGALDPAFLGAVLDFLIMDDAWIMAFCDSENIPYEQPLRARAALPGGEQMHWT